VGRRTDKHHTNPKTNKQFSKCPGKKRRGGGVKNKKPENWGKFKKKVVIWSGEKKNPQDWRGPN